MTIFANGWALILLAAVMGCDVAMGQKASKVAPVDVAITYDALHANDLTGDNFWMQGGAVELGARLYRGFGIAARVEGGHVGAGTANRVPLSLVTTIFGLRYTVASHSGLYVIFGDGVARQSNGRGARCSDSLTSRPPPVSTASVLLLVVVPPVVESTGPDPFKNKL